MLVRSRPAARAITSVASRTRAGRSSIVQAAMCALVGHYVSLSTCLVTAVSANRFLPELANFIGPLSRDALLAVDCDVPTFDELVRRVRHQAMFAYAKGCDDTTLATTIGRLGRERGTWYARDCEFNDCHDSIERHPGQFVDVPDAFCARRTEPAKARFVGRDEERAEIRDFRVVSRESFERALEPRTVAARKVSLYEIGRHLRSTIAERSGSNNRANRRATVTCHSTSSAS